MDVLMIAYVFADLLHGLAAFRSHFHEVIAQLGMTLARSLAKSPHAKP